MSKIIIFDQSFLQKNSTITKSSKMLNQALSFFHIENNIEFFRNQIYCNEEKPYLKKYQKLRALSLLNRIKTFSIHSSIQNGSRI